MKVNSDKCAYFRKALIFKWGPTAGEANRPDIISKVQPSFRMSQHIHRQRNDSFQLLFKISFEYQRFLELQKNCVVCRDWLKWLRRIGTSFMGDRKLSYYYAK